MYLIPVAWIYVALMMAVAEATNSNGTVLGAIITFIFYGLLPVGLILYFIGTPGRKRALRAKEAAQEQFVAGPPQDELAPSGGSDPRSGGAWGQQPVAAQASIQPDAGGETPADPVAPVRKEP